MLNHINPIGMKRKLIGRIAVITGIFMVQACEERNIDFDKLPGAAQSFIMTYFPDADVVRAERDRDDGQKEYTVWLSDGTEIEFDENGSWTSIDCNTTVLPDGILPQKATDYIAQNYPQEKAYKVEKIRGGYEVGITNGLELIFDSDWNFSRLDR